MNLSSQRSTQCAFNSVSAVKFFLSNLSIKHTAHIFTGMGLESHEGGFSLSQSPRGADLALGAPSFTCALPLPLSQGDVWGFISPPDQAGLGRFVLAGLPGVRQVGGGGPRASGSSLCCAPGLPRAPGNGTETSSRPRFAAVTAQAGDGRVLRHAAARAAAFSCPLCRERWGGWRGREHAARCRSTEPNCPWVP